MSLLISFLLSSNAVFSSQNQAVKNSVLTNYSSEIEVNSYNSGWSLFGCPTENIELVGQDPIDRKSRKVSITLYHPLDDGNQKSVILVPPTGGVNILDRGYANKLCHRGISVALIDGWDHQLDSSLDFSMHDNGALRYLSAIRHTIEFLNSRNINSIGLLGTSIGAIGGALAFGVDKRISAATLIVGSARFADVIAFSDENGATQLREARMKLMGIKTLEQYRDILRNNIKIEPTNYIKNLNNRPSLVITADDDTTVPSQYQYELVKDLGGKHLNLSGNHLEVIKKTFWHECETIINFFIKNL